MVQRVWKNGPAVMGILNNSPDSFHKESVHESTQQMVAEAEQMISHGANIIDIGAESNKPDANLISSEKETSRLEPAIREISKLNTLVSVDTWKADVANAAIEAGADIINDISGMDDPDMASVAAENDVPIVIGHSTDVLADFGEGVEYDDVITEITDELEFLAEKALDAGVRKENIILDPGVNFGKDSTDSVKLLAQLDQIHELGYPTLVGHSRKIEFSDQEGFGIDEDMTLPATIALTTASIERGADIVRVHDIPENFEAVLAGLNLRQCDPKL